MRHSLVGRIQEDEATLRVLMTRWAEAAAIAVVLLFLVVLYIVVGQGG